MKQEEVLLCNWLLLCFILPGDVHLVPLSPFRLQHKNEPEKRGDCVTRITFGTARQLCDARHIWALIQNEVSWLSFSNQQILQLQKKCFSPL
jgi:hypothetical protein